MLGIIAVIWVRSCVPYPGVPSAAQDSSQEGSLTINDGATLTNNRNVTLRVNPPTLPSPALEMSLSADGATWTPWQPIAAVEFELPEGEGVKTVFARLRDGSGGESGPVWSAITLDTIPPDATLACVGFLNGNGIVATSDAPDAVAMQISENPDQWPAWEPYASPRLFAASSTGIGELYARYRDEAGNVSPVVSSAVEVDWTEEAPGRLVVGIELSSLTGDGERGVTIALDARGMVEMEVAVNDQIVLMRTGFESGRAVKVGGAANSLRIVVKMWDEGSGEHQAELRFLWHEIARRGPAGEGEAEPLLFAGVSSGAWQIVRDFDSITMLGERHLDAGALWLIRSEVGMNVLPPVAVTLSGEYAGGSEVGIASVGLNVKVRCFRGSLGLAPGSLFVEAGGFQSWFMTESDFGDVGAGLGLRMGARMASEIGSDLALEIGVDYRRVRFEMAEIVLAGDADVVGDGLAAYGGLLLKF